MITELKDFLKINETPEALSIKNIIKLDIKNSVPNEKLTKELALQNLEKFKEAELNNAPNSYGDYLYEWFTACLNARMYDEDEAYDIANIVMSTSFYRIKLILSNLI